MGTKLKRTDFYGFGEKIKKLKEKKKILVRMSSTSFKSNIKGSYLKTSVFTSIRNKIERRLTTFETPWSLEQ